jgi:hypothetical protein
MLKEHAPIGQKEPAGHVVGETEPAKANTKRKKKMHSQKQSFKK